MLYRPFFILLDNYNGEDLFYLLTCINQSFQQAETLHYFHPCAW